MNTNKLSVNFLIIINRIKRISVISHDLTPLHLVSHWLIPRLIHCNTLILFVRQFSLEMIWHSHNNLVWVSGEELLYLEFNITFNTSCYSAVSWFSWYKVDLLWHANCFYLKQFTSDNVYVLQFFLVHLFLFVFFIRISLGTVWSLLCIILFYTVL